MKKLLLIPAILLALCGYSAAQIAGIAGVGNRTPGVPTPVLSPGGDLYTGAQSVTITESDPNAAACYTTDGTQPGFGFVFISGRWSLLCGPGNKYLGPISVSSTETLTVVAGDPGLGTSRTVAEAYIISPTSSGFSDSFPYASGNLTSVDGGNWANNSSVSTLLFVHTGSPNSVGPSNTSSCSAGAGNGCFVRWTGAGGTAPASQSTQVTYTAFYFQALGPAVRVSSTAQTGYAAYCSGGASGDFPACALVKVVNGTATTLVGTGSTFPTGATVKLTASGTTTTSLTLTVNGATYATYTDSSSPITSGTWGLLSNGQGTSRTTAISNATGTTP